MDIAVSAHNRSETSHRPLCPSAPSHWRGAEIFGVVGGTVSDPRIGYLERTLPVSHELLALSAPASPTEVFRVAAPCACHACGHYQGGRCHLVEKVVRQLPAVVDELPMCMIRHSCRWFNQEGASACFRCPMVVTDAPPLDQRMISVTDMLH